LLEISKPEDLNLLEKSLTPVLLCWYASVGDLSSLKELIDLGVDLNLHDYDKRTALHLASAENQHQIIDLLCLHEVELKMDYRGETAFHDAIRADSLLTVRRLKAKFSQTCD
jgi:glutaminase